MSFTDNASTNRAKEALDSFSFVCGTERSTLDPRQPTGLTPDGTSRMPASLSVQLGSSPRPQKSKPQPIKLSSPIRYIDRIDEVPEEPVDMMAQLPPEVRAEIEPYIDAVREIVRFRSFGDPSTDIPAPIFPGRFYLGSASNAMDIDGLNAARITAVLNCASGSCLTNAEYYGEDFAYHEFDARDADGYDMSQHLDEAVAFYIKCMEERRSILIHCVAGINRSAFIAIYLYMVVTGATFTQAVTHCFYQRPIILTNESFIAQLALVAHKERRL